MADDESSELSSLSSLSPAPSDDESDVKLEREDGILRFFHKVPKSTESPAKEPTPPPRKRAASPPHEHVLADNEHIAFIVMFRSRFSDAFPKSLAHFGPQDIERDVTESAVGERVEHFLCALLGVLLNRKQDVKPGHYNRALEEALQTHKMQWPEQWEDKTPIAGGATFGSMNPTERLLLLRTLALWSLSSSEAVRAIIAQSYKQTRHDDDLNQPLSVQPWGSDSYKRRYYLVEGRDDTSFRVYREGNPAAIKDRQWWSVAGSIDEIKALADRLEKEDGGPKAKKLALKMLAAVPRFEATEEKRKRREYRQIRKMQFKRPEPGFSLYEGRTRGKRMKYTYSDDEDEFMTDSTTRRSTRNTGTHTPAEPAGPVVTASGRQIRAPTRMNGDPTSRAPSVRSDGLEENTGANREGSTGPTGRPRRSAAVNHGLNGWGVKGRKAEEYISDEEEEEEGSEPDLGDDEEEDEHVPDESEEEEDEFDEDEDMVDDDTDDQSTRVVKIPAKVTFNESGTKVVKVTKVPRGPDSPESMGDKEEQIQPEINAAPRPVINARQHRHRQGQVKEKTPEVGVGGATEPPLSNPQLTPLSATPTSLAFRGSPEKPLHTAQTVNVGAGE